MRKKNIKVILVALLMLTINIVHANTKLGFDLKKSSWRGIKQANTIIIFGNIDGELAYSAPSTNNKPDEYIAGKGNYKVLGNTSIEIIWESGKKSIALFDFKNKEMMLANPPFEESTFSLKKSEIKNLDTSYYLNKLKKDIQGIQAAYYGFIDRYRQIPGDWIEQDASVAIPEITTGGNGDGKINNNGGIWVEPLAVWEHLSKSGFVEGNYTGGNSFQVKNNKAPRNPFGGYMMLLNSDDYYDQHKSSAKRTIFIIGRKIPVDILEKLDRLMDDGMPGTGVMRLSTIHNSDFGEIVESDSECISSTDRMSKYNVSKKGLTCNAVYLY